MQRDVEIEIETVDKSGGFIGTLWLNKNENAAVVLVQEGLATVHSYSADTLSWAKQLYAAEVCFVSHPRGAPRPGVSSEFGSALTPLASSF
jgi:staphylococcal nuclease domain-containing protein 1